MIDKRRRKIARHRRVRAKISGTSKCPRLSVFRSSRHIYAQLIDDESSKTLAQFNDLAQKSRKKNTTKTMSAKEVGLNLGGEVLKKGFSRVIFDRGSYKYHGRVKTLAEGLREAGLKF